MVRRAKNIIGTTAAGAVLVISFVAVGAVVLAMVIGTSAAKTFGFPKKH